MSINKEAVKLWVDALRSGEYKQTTTRLRRTNGYCCLGVLCDVYSKETGFGEWEGNSFSDDYSFNLTDIGREYTVLPNAVMDWIGIKTNNPRLNKINNAAELNDKGKTFLQIADLIEKKYKLKE